jgi:NAD(P)-dependent dehydrogenase (short-subunit alcohol dehydrogenase family)
MADSDARVAIVTGAGQGTGGLGRAIALRLARSGLRLMVADVDPKVQRTAEEVDSHRHPGPRRLQRRQGRRCRHDGRTGQGIRPLRHHRSTRSSIWCAF